MSEAEKTNFISQDQEDKLYTFILERTAEYSEVEDLLASGCKGFDNYTVAELIEEVTEYLAQEEDMSDLPEYIQAIIGEYQANEAAHKLLKGESDD